MREPPVKLLIRKGGHGNAAWRHEREWPLARTRWTKFYLRPDPRARGGEVEGTLATEAPRKGGSVSYAASGMTKAGVATASWTSTVLAGSLPRLGASFETAPLAQPLEVTGPVVLVLWVASTTEDMDVFATLRNIGRDGKDVFEIGQQGQPVPVAKGWLRASHRALDEKLSTPFRPYHRHADPAVARERRGRADGRRDLADLDGVRARAPYPDRHPAARRRRRRPLHPLRRGLQLRQQHYLYGR